MAYPTGSGSERLMRGAINAQSNTLTHFKFDGTSPTTGTSSYTVPALHIITVLEIIMCEKANAAEIMSIYAQDGTNNIGILQSQNIGAYQTFVFSDKIVLQGGDSMGFNLASAGNVDVWYSYIDQDWT
tara:strand:+ start:516 stop:899 length:384 start_codon:yes stop_codon:yes gene_type:complete